MIPHMRCLYHTLCSNIRVFVVVPLRLLCFVLFGFHSAFRDPNLSGATVRGWTNIQQYDRFGEGSRLCGCYICHLRLELSMVV